MTPCRRGETGSELTGAQRGLCKVIWSAALALIPLALNGDASGNEIQSPMAVVILGGLLSATLLNLYVIPIIYRWVRMR